MRRVWFPWRGAEPHVVVEIFRNRFGGLPDAADVSGHVPREACMRADADGQRPAEKPRTDESRDRFDRRSELVELPVEAEPCVETEHTAVAAGGVHNGLPFAERARHRFFRPYVAAVVERIDVLQGVPMRRRDDVDDVDVLAVDHFTEIEIRLAVVPRVFGALRGCFAAGFADVADGDQFGLRVVEHISDMAVAHAADADDGVVDLVVGARAAVRGEHMVRDDGEARSGGDAGLDELSARKLRGRIGLEAVRHD